MAGKLGEPKQRYTGREELANALTHGVGTALGLAGLAVLVTFASLRGDVWRIVSFAIYGTTLVLLYLASTLYHSFGSTKWRDFFRVLDHAAIFLLIAGSYTPFTLVTLRGPWGWTLFGLIWGIGLAGICTTVMFLKAPKWLIVALYVGMGWLAVIALKPLIAALPAGGMWLIAAGGLCYTGGVVFYMWHSLRYHHAIWHLFVLAGSLAHYFAILIYVLPMRA